MYTARPTRIQVEKSSPSLKKKLVPAYVITIAYAVIMSNTDGNRLPFSGDEDLPVLPYTAEWLRVGKHSYECYIMVFDFTLRGTGKDNEKVYNQIKFATSSSHKPYISNVHFNIHVHVHVDSLPLIAPGLPHTLGPTLFKPTSVLSAVLIGDLNWSSDFSRQSLSRLRSNRQDICALFTLDDNNESGRDATISADISLLGRLMVLDFRLRGVREDNEKVSNKRARDARVRIHAVYHYENYSNSDYAKHSQINLATSSSHKPIISTHGLRHVRSVPVYGTVRRPTQRRVVAIFMALMFKSSNLTVYRIFKSQQTLDG
ncbi:hypothetical protein DFH11DRAFT_1543172 [Phellopilus nigrolimitatus]|nr:hypothetical protein DFH11DRAFT_1543172 [Phellopilus nigrolimitatus]